MKGGNGKWNRKYLPCHTFTAWWGGERSRIFVEGGGEENWVQEGEIQIHTFHVVVVVVVVPGLAIIIRHLINVSRLARQKKR